MPPGTIHRLRRTIAAAMSSTYDDLLPRALPLYTLPPLTASSRAIVIGMGGGCDVFASTVLGRMWQSQATAGAVVLFANCIGPRPLRDDHSQVSPFLYRVPAEPVALVPGDQGYGTTKLDNSVDPRGPEGAPFMFMVPKVSAASLLDVLSSISLPHLHTSPLFSFPLACGTKGRQVGPLTR